MNRMNLREAGPADIPHYLDHMNRHFRESGRDGDLIFHPVIEFENWNRTEQIAKLEQALLAPFDQPGWQKIWIVELGGEIVADCLLRSGHMQATSHRCQFAIGIERLARGQGLGERLSLQAIAWARAQLKLEWIDLWAFAHNTPAIRLYEKLGFQKIDTVSDQFRVHGQKIHDVHMVLKLKE